MLLLVINSGSSSIKFQVFEALHLKVRAKGLIEKIGKPDTKAKLYVFEKDGFKRHITIEKSLPTHKKAIELMEELLNEAGFSRKRLIAIGHRVVHGGEEFKEPVIVNKKILEKLESLNALAPLHNPANIEGIKVAMKRAPHIPQVAVFDTSFHQTLPAYAYLYALPYEFYKNNKVRRYGFHGTSHLYVSKKASDYLKVPYEKLKMISIHLGNGASIAAISCGRCIDTSMGFTPLEGLMMGTRCGDIDPAIVFYLHRETNLSYKEIEKLLYEKSGLLGICNENDMRNILKKAQNGDAQAKLAVEMYCYRIKKYIGAYYAVLSGLNCVVFTGGVGENSPLIRHKSIKDLSHLGILLDEDKNTFVQKDIIDISKKTSKVKILVIPTNEELEIARQTLNKIS